MEDGWGATSAEGTDWVLSRDMQVRETGVIPEGYNISSTSF
jgi:hypothetical protein